jgi:outer membrane protein
MKKILLLLTLVLGFNFFVNAQTEKGKWLISGASNIGFNSVSTKFKSDGMSVDGPKVNTFNVSPSIGYFVIDNLSVGLSLGYTNTSTKGEVDEKVSSSTFTVLPSLTYFFTKNTSVKPYLAAGAGYASFKEKYGSVAETNGGFAWEAQGGLAYFVSQKAAISLGLGYGQVSVEQSGFSVNANTLGAKIGFSLFL